MKNELAYVSIIMVGILGLIIGYSMSPSTPAIGSSSSGVHVVLTPNNTTNVTAAPSGSSKEGNTGQAKGFATQGYGVYAKVPK